MSDTAIPFLDDDDSEKYDDDEIDYFDEDDFEQEEYDETYGDIK